MGHEHHSSGILDMLEKLLDEFIEERKTLEKVETDSIHAFNLMVHDLTTQINQATTDREAKADSKAKNLQAKADAEGDLTDTTTTRDADQKYLDDLVATCEQKATDFESRQQLRTEELEAIAKAIEIISSGAVSGNADKYLPTLVQKSKSLAALRADSQSKAQSQVALFLQSKAKELNSRLL